MCAHVYTQHFRKYVCICFCMNGVWVPCACAVDVFMRIIMYVLLCVALCCCVLCCVLCINVTKLTYPLAVSGDGVPNELPSVSVFMWDKNEECWYLLTVCGVSLCPCLYIRMYVQFYCVRNPLTVPHFKEVIVRALTCDTCGYRSNEVKSGAGVSEKGTRITLHLTDPSDLSRDILKVKSHAVEPV